MTKFKVSVVASLVTLYTGLSVSTVSANQDADVLPDASSGECYAKVLVPPVFKTESVEVVVREATEELEIIAAKYTSTVDRVLVKDKFSELSVVEPVYETVEKKVQTAAAEQKWVRDGLDGTVGVSSGTLADLRASGINTNNVNPGQCFYEHHKPAVYKTVQEKVMISAASEELSVQGATFNSAAKQVMVRAASKRLIEVPAVFETVEDKVLIEPAKSVWKKGTGPIMKIDNATGEIMCLVDIPAVYETFQRKAISAPPLTTAVVVPAEFDNFDVETLVTDAREVRTPVPATYDSVDKTELVSQGGLKWVAGAPGDAALHGKHTGNVVCFTEEPAKFATIEQKVVKTPGSFTKVEVPAVFKNVSVEKLVADATVKKTPVPEIKKDYIKRVKVSDARLEWRPVLCETNTTESTVTDIQQALSDAGFNPGRIDGVLGRSTLQAIEQFQKSKNMAQGGITFATLEALGIKL